MMAKVKLTKEIITTKKNLGDWNVVELGKVIHLTSGMHLNPEDYNLEGEGIPYFTGPTDYTNELSEVKKWTRKKEPFARKGDVLLTVKGSGVGGHFMLELEEVSIGRQIMALKANDNCSARFIYYSLGTKQYNFQELAKGNMIPGLTRSDILTMKIFLPPLSEQKAIASVLTTWDTAIQKIEQLIAQKEQRKKWLMQQLLTGKKRLKGFKSKWKEMHIRDVAKEISIRNKSDKQLTVLSCTKYDGLVPSLEYFGRKIFADDVSTYKIVPKRHFAYATNHIEEGSIGYQDTLDEALISPMYTVFKTDKSVNEDFFYKLLKSHALVYQYQNRMEGSIDRRGGLRWNAFSIIKIKLPSIEEQTAIAQVLQTVDKEISLLKAKVEKLRKQKKGLMQQLLTGKKRLKI